MTESDDPPVPDAPRAPRPFPRRPPTSTPESWSDFVRRQACADAPLRKAAVAGSRRADSTGTLCLPASLDTAARVTGVAEHVVRYWVAELPTLRPARDGHGRFMFDESAIEVLARVRALLYDDGLTIAQARRRLQNERGIRPLPTPGETPG